MVDYGSILGMDISRRVFFEFINVNPYLRLANLFWDVGHCGAWWQVSVHTGLISQLRWWLMSGQTMPSVNLRKGMTASPALNSPIKYGAPTYILGLWVWLGTISWSLEFLFLLLCFQHFLFVPLQVIRDFEKISPNNFACLKDVSVKFLLIWLWGLQPWALPHILL